MGGLIVGEASHFMLLCQLLVKISPSTIPFQFIPLDLGTDFAQPPHLVQPSQITDLSIYTDTTKRIFNFLIKGGAQNEGRWKAKDDGRQMHTHLPYEKPICIKIFTQSKSNFVLERNVGVQGVPPNLVKGFHVSSHAIPFVLSSKDVLIFLTTLKPRRFETHFYYFDIACCTCRVKRGVICLKSQCKRICAVANEDSTRRSESGVGLWHPQCKRVTLDFLECLPSTPGIGHYTSKKGIVDTVSFVNSALREGPLPVAIFRRFQAVCLNGCEYWRRLTRDKLVILRSQHQWDLAGRVSFIGVGVPLFFLSLILIKPSNGLASSGNSYLSHSHSLNVLFLSWLHHGG
ncbi:uncharacterized protein BDR25DRAFT_356957 [Lindgomyces ingoldianus]|uniref:Uncharacterized protein n=1 Tax=Lindgomyces ingoldianus TaxID=673940 RepID=A0ACB6QQA8_9PLEO|nr:uncharacterized protein BDR25DRAFT_356957 [Lindgomyces ingoldianus]KAF2469184.1 hypothetical protein BDR25DRAFT_356957 [Lindgomyces ingoldianus]